MNRANYDREMQREIERRRGEGRLPRLLLHACCAPCSSACLERLLPDFALTVFYYNPNIDEEAEYRKRAAEERRLIGEINRRLRERPASGAQPESEAACGTFRLPAGGGEGQPAEIAILTGDYRPADFYAAVRGLETEPEGGARCAACFRLRLSASARAAAEGGFDYFTTTLTISPLKNAERLNAIGAEAAERYGVAWLPSDFKKREGYRRSIELSREFSLYRQDYCGCSFSRRARSGENNQ